MLMSNSQVRALHGSNLLHSLLVQLMLCWILGVLLPPAIYFFPHISEAIDFAPSQHSIRASLLASAAAIILSRKVVAFPGVKHLGTIVPAFLITFGSAAIVILVTRIEYSSAVLTLNFVCSLCVHAMTSIVSGRRQFQYFAVPGGKVERLQELNLEYLPMSSCELPISQNAIVVADLHRDMPDEWERTLARAALNGVPVFHYKQIYEATTGRVQIEHLSENSFGSLLPNLPYVRSKRAIDLIFSLAILPILAVPMLFAALLVKLDSPGPIFFRQQRVGYRGEIFKVVKFRTMRLLRDDEIEDSEDGRRARSMTQTNDPRISRIGAFLRRTRIDELPQLFNIIAGEMSLIGPRPEAIDLANWYEKEIPFYSYRHVVRPGITGWAQVNQGHVTELGDIDRKLQYDFFYIKNFSYWLDLLITFRTVLVIFTGFGAR